MPFPIYDTQDEVPEAQRDVYEERDGKWHPRVPDVAKLSSALDTERTRAETEEAARKKAERDLADLRRKEKATQTGITAEQLDELRSEDAQRRKPIEDENVALKARLQKLTHRDRVQAVALSPKVGVMAERIDDAMLILVDAPNPRTKLADDGETILVLDKDGKTTTAKIEDFLAQDFKKEKPWLYKGSGASGSGASGSSRNGSEIEQPAANDEVIAEKRSQVAGAF